MCTLNLLNLFPSWTCENKTDGSCIVLFCIVMRCFGKAFVWLGLGCDKSTMWKGLLVGCVQWRKRYWVARGDGLGREEDLGRNNLALCSTEVLNSFVPTSHIHGVVESFPTEWRISLRFHTESVMGTSGRVRWQTPVLTEWLVSCSLLAILILVAQRQLC